MFIYTFFLHIFGTKYKPRNCLNSFLCIFLYLFTFYFLYLIYLLCIYIYCRSSSTFHLFSHFSTHSFILKGYTAVSHARIHGQFACSTFLHAANIFSGEHSNIFYIYPRPFIMHLLLLQPHLPPLLPPALLLSESVFTYMYFLRLPRPLDTLLSNVVLSLFIIKIGLKIFGRIFATFFLL